MTHRKNSQHIQRTVLASALATAGLGLISTSTHAGIMVTDYDFMMYGDFAEGKGIFANSDKPIKIYDKFGTYRGEITKPLDVSGVADWLFLTVIDPGFGATANHLGNVGGLTFGVNSKLIYNDGTLFAGSADKPYKPGVVNDAEWKRILGKAGSNNYNTYKENFLKYLGTSYNTVYNSQITVLNGGYYKENGDFSILRMNKIFIDAAPVPTVEDHSKIKVGDTVARIGAGLSGFVARNSKIKQSIQYGTPIGGLGIIDDLISFDTTRQYTNPDDFTSPSTYQGTRIHVRFENPAKTNDKLEVGTLRGDSGSPMWWWDNDAQQWKLAGVTSRNLNGSAEVVDFGQKVEWTGNFAWAKERINYFTSKPVQLTAGDTVVFHGQNNQNGIGNIHIVSQGTEDIVDDKLQTDINRVKDLNTKDIDNQVYIINQNRKSGTGRNNIQANKPGYYPPAENQLNNNFYQDKDGIKYVKYYGFAYGYDFSKFGNKNDGYVARQIGIKSNDLYKNVKNIVIEGAGKGSQHEITFGADVNLGKNTLSQNTIDLTGSSITLRNGDFVLKQNDKIQERKLHIGMFITAGYIIDQDASLSYQLLGWYNDPIHKLGKGTLKIEGSGNQYSPLNVGEGTVELNRQGGTATNYLKLASGRATAKLMANNQLPAVNGIFNSHALGFGQNGGTFDFNGFDRNTYWSDIFHLDGGATMANFATCADKKVTFNFVPTGKRSYLGSFLGNFDIVYNPNTSDASAKEWHLKGAVNITGDFKVTNGTTLTLGDVQTERGWGFKFDDRYDAVTYLSQTTTLENNSNLNVGRNTLFVSNVHTNDNATINVHNKGKYTDLSRPEKYGIEGQSQLEKTIIGGSLDLTASSKLKLDADQEGVIDVHSVVTGQGTVTLNGKGTINFTGPNNQFTGQVKVCNADSNNPECTTPLTFDTQLGSEVKFDEANLPVLPELAKDFATETTATTTSTASNGSTLSSTQGVTLTGYANLLAEDNASLLLNGQPTIGASGKPVVTDTEVNGHKQWATDQESQGAQENEKYQFGTHNEQNSLVPAPKADSLVLNFFSKDALFTNASVIDTNNAQVILHTNFAGATANDTYQWDLGNVQGDAFLVKSDASTLQIKNYNLRGTMFVLNGTVVTDRVTGHVVIGKGATLLADARGSEHNVTLKGRVVNAGEIYLTKKAEKLPAQLFASDKPITVTPPVINNSSSSTALTATSSSATNSSTGPSLASSDLTLSNGVLITEAMQPRHIALLADDSSLTLANSSTPVSTAANNGTIQTGNTASRAVSTLEIDGDYYGQNGKIIYDLGEDAYQVNVKGNVDGVTELVVKDIKASMATGKEKFELFTATGTVAKDAVTLANGFVSAGIYDYKLFQAGNRTYIVNQYDEKEVEITPTEKPQDPPATSEQPPKEEQTPPSTTTPEESKPTLDSSNSNKDDGFLGNQGGTVVPPTTDSGTTNGNQGSTDKDNSTGNGTDVTLPAPVPEPKPEPAPAPTLGTENGNTSDNSSTDNNPGNGNNGSTDVTLPESSPSKPDNSEPSQPAPQPPVEVTQPAESTLPENNQPNNQPQQGEDKPNADQGNGDKVSETPAPNQPGENTPPASQPEDQPTEQPSTEAKPESKPSTPTVEVITPAGPRIINSSVGTLLANRRFISNLNVTPMSLASRPGFFMDVDRDSESLDFTGATYSSSYSATRTLIGQSFTLRPNVTAGVFVNAGSAKSQIDNQVNSATGTVTAFGVGGFAATNVGQYLYVSGAAQYLYANSTVEGTHHQSEVLNGGFVAAQVASQDIQLGQYITVRPYALLQVELTPTSHFISRIGEELGTVEADRVTKAIGVQANLHVGKFGLEVDAYQNLGSRVTEFKSNYTSDYISAANNNYRVKTTASYQVLPNVKVGTYLNLRGKQTTTGMSLDVKW